MSGFPATRPSAVAWLRSRDEATRARGVKVIAEVYWPAVYKHLRLKFGMSREQAEDTVQGFFLRLVEGDLFAGYDPERARFRTFLRQCLDNFAVDTHRRASRKRRKAEIELDIDSVEATLALAPAPDAAAFDREWVRRVVEVAVQRVLARLEKRKQPVHAELFRRFHLADEPPSYDAVAAELGIKTTDVTNWLHVARREFRRVALELLREVTANRDEYVEEARAVFGIELADK